MIIPQKTTSVFQQIITSGRVALLTMTICCLLYGLVILSFGQWVAPGRADGSLLRDEHGEIVGSTLIAQGFTRPEYFWPRPSAVAYNAAAAGGSNLSPTHPEIRIRAQAIVAKMGAGKGHPLPADLVTTSGSGLDPHITLAAATYQAQRVADARGRSVRSVTALLEKFAKRPGGALTLEPVVNVLLVNMALDRMEQ
ncbi:MAG: potassium-transporting ATPase subunit KdpC [Desulfatitalea sp.]